MLHKMSEVRGWAHEDMMKMSKTVFYRYYGYWYQEKLQEHYEREFEERKRKASEKTSDKKWKTL